MEGCELIVLSVLSVACASCADGAAPAYVRIEGPAPAMPSVPPAPAHLVAFWASWCEPCVAETPALRRLARDRPGDLRVVVVSQEPEAATRSFFSGDVPEELNVRIDPAGALASSFGVGQLPAAVLVRDGRLVARFDGPQPWDSRATARTLRRLLER